MKKIMLLAALAAALWAVIAEAQQQYRPVATTMVMEDTYKQVTKWFPIASQVQGSLHVFYIGNASVAATDTVRMFLKTTGPDTTATPLVVTRDLWHSNTGMGGRGAAVFDTLSIKFVPRAGAVTTAWSVPLPVFIYPGSYVSLWAARDSTNASAAEITIYHVGTPIN